MTSGCAVVNRAERFAQAFHREFTTEYDRRSDPNNPTPNRYRALQELGELQRHVQDGTVEQSEAIARIEREELDEQAFRAVRKIAENAAQDAFRESVPETDLVENPFRADNTGRRRNEGLCDLLTPRLSLNISYSDSRLTLEPTIKLGFYRVKFTSDNTFDHRIHFNYDRWYFFAGIEHHRDEIHNASMGVSYGCSPGTSIGTSYSYTNEPEDHRMAIGFASRF
ncbi:hypothetical protein HY490_00810 [Candidatus Woesearchaeota archaeon]|nr:hypothetical protein [Candidatus Woesearchaeota archaeon]